MFYLNYCSRDALSLSSLPLLINFYFTFFWSFNSFSSSYYLGITLARPKSQILTLHKEFVRKFEGFKSRWIILAEWIKLTEQRALYKKVTICSSLN